MHIKSESFSASGLITAKWVRDMGTTSFFHWGALLVTCTRSQKTVITWNVKLKKKKLLFFSFPWTGPHASLEENQCWKKGWLQNFLLIWISLSCSELRDAGTGLSHLLWCDLCQLLGRPCWRWWMAQHVSLPAVGLPWWDRVCQSTDCVQDQHGAAGGVTLTGTLWWQQFHCGVWPQLWQLLLNFGSSPRCWACCGLTSPLIPRFTLDFFIKCRVPRTISQC